MRRQKASRSDWRDAAAYAPLLDADRSLFAWEWLRRDAGYRAAYLQASSLDILSSRISTSEQFGLVAFESPDRSVPDARPLWRVDVHPYVLGARALACGSAADLFDLHPVRDLARIVAGDSADHLLLSDGLRTIRLDAPLGALTSGPVCLGYDLFGLHSALPPLLTLRRLLALCRTGSFARALHEHEARARRWILALRAWDAIAAGARQRDIAAELLSRSVTEPRWRSREPSLRSQVQRLVRTARHMAAGGWRDLLDPA